MLLVRGKSSAAVAATAAAPAAAAAAAAEASTKLNVVLEGHFVTKTAVCRLVCLLRGVWTRYG